MLMNTVIIIISAFTGFAVLHSFFSLNSVKDWFRRQWPSFFAFYRLTFNVLQTLIFLIMFLLLPRPQETIWHLEGWHMILMRMLQLFSFGGLVFTLRDFSSSEFTGLAAVRRFLKVNHRPEADEHYTLNTSGMYAVSRHPLYLFTVLLVLFEPHMTLFKALFLGWLILYFYIGSYFEERRLVKRFGNRYIRYRHRVSRILPFKWLRRCLGI